MLTLGLHSLAEHVHYAIRHKIFTAPKIRFLVRGEQKFQSFHDPPSEKIGTYTKQRSDGLAVIGTEKHALLACRVDCVPDPESRSCA